MYHRWHVDIHLWSLSSCLCCLRPATQGQWLDSRPLQFSYMTVTLRVSDPCFPLLSPLLRAQKQHQSDDLFVKSLSQKPGYLPHSADSDPGPPPAPVPGGVEFTKHDSCRDPSSSLLDPPAQALSWEPGALDKEVLPLPSHSCIRYSPSTHFVLGPPLGAGVVCDKASKDPAQGC